jgi:tRNA (mo5U34)-methyltransferase
MNGTSLKDKAREFGIHFSEYKKQINPEIAWYPHSTLANFIHLEDFFNKYPLDTLVYSDRIADIGAADGDLAFFMGSLGYRVDIIDYAPTNYNGLMGARALQDALSTKNDVQVFEVNLDEQFSLPESRYSLIFCLGILYHFKNPYYVLEALSKKCAYLVMSTRVAKFTPDGRYIGGSSLAYLLSPNESNNDQTNYWVFTESCLERLVNRAGWDLIHKKCVGNIVASNPSDGDKDERCFMLLRSRVGSQ